ncbi:MAG: hypothetical protein HRT45_08060 [Bdellovibrionales bacterium]|nr:hypothetical protein [Bdellovibrionales bacterium]
MRRDQFVKIIAKNLRDQIDGQVLLALSGGADSWFLYFVLRELEISFTPVTLKFEKEEYGESRLVESYFSSLEDSPRFEWVSCESVLEEFRAFSKRTGIVIYNLHPISKWILAKRAKALGFSQVVTGDGADQWFRGESNCDLYPIVQRCFEVFDLDLITPFACEETWGVAPAKQIVYDYVGERLNGFKKTKTVKLYPDDDFLPLSCLEQSRLLVEV